MSEIDSLTDPLWDIALADSCQLTVLQASGAQQCALALSFAAGSHDEPTDALGMAHFLEHLVFRGSQNYPSDDGLMAFVQRNGGKVNAQTQARQTLFHFQVDSPIFISALERLVDMLVLPCLDDAMLVSEREVLNEEFRLYCQAPQMLMDAALGVCLSSAHPLQRFYAGHRDSLRIEDAGFKTLLAAFHQAAYMRSQLKMVLVIPDDWSCWDERVLMALQPLTRGIRQRSSVALNKMMFAQDSVLQLCLPVPEKYFVVHLPIHHGAAGLAELAEKMQHALAVSIGQTFLTYVKEQGWCSSISVRAPYAGQEQGVLTVEFKQLAGDHNALLSAFDTWLRQWREQLHSTEQQAYERQAQANRWLVADPLSKAQHILSAGWPLQGISLACLAALDALIECFDQRAFVQVIAGPDAVEGSYDRGLPLQVERLERDSASSDQMACTARFTFSTELGHKVQNSSQLKNTERYALVEHQSGSFPKGLSVCYWGWSVADPQNVATRIQSRLAPLFELLNYNAVRWQVECTDNYVFIRIAGPTAYLAVALNQLLATLELPLVEDPAEITGHFALRRLLQQLPAALAGGSNAASTATVALARQAQSALWLGEPLASGFVDECYLQRLQHLPNSTAVQPSSPGWKHVTDSRSDDALLIVHIPLPALSIADKDRMRVLNKVFIQHFQSVLQRYLRDERGLCYAVFVMPSAQAENEGMVCAVQSSKVSAAQILTEIRQCLHGFEGLLPEYLPRLHADALLQVEQLERQTLGIDRLSELMFRHWREQRLGSGFREEAEAARLLTYADIEQYSKTIQDHTRWFLLSNQPSVL